MPALETMDLLQEAQLWEATNAFDDEGEHTYDSRREIKVRWQYVNDEAINPQGNVIAVDAKVVVDEQIPVGSFMWLGSIKDLPASGTPASDIMQVQAYLETPSLKGKRTRRTLLLNRYGDSLP